MLRHMLIQLPLLLAAGWLLAEGTQASTSWFAKFDQHGFTGLTGFFLITAYWMIPRALEQSLTFAPGEIGKFVSLLGIGMLLPSSLSRASWIVQLFYLGNYAWMTAIAGIQYQVLPQRLCNAYLLDDQADAGMGLVALSIIVSVIWCWRLAPVILGTMNPTTDIVQEQKESVDVAW